MTVAELLDRISSRELTEWIAYFNLEHLGESPEDRADLRMGILAAVTANVNRGKGRAHKPEDFMPAYERAEPTPEQLHQEMLALARSQGRRAK